MKKNNVLDLKKPEETFQDALTQVMREGALAVALEKEVEEFLQKYAHLTNEEGHREVVRNGYLPEREIQTGIGAMDVKVPRVKDKRKGGEKVRFNSQILPPYLRRTKSLDELIPWLYLKGLSTGDFSEALSALLGKDAPGLSASTVSRGELAKRPRCLAEAVSGGQGVRLLLGRRSALWRSYGGREAVHPGCPWRDRRWAERACRHDRRLPRERAIVV